MWHRRKTSILRPGAQRYCRRPRSSPLPAPEPAEEVAVLDHPVVDIALGLFWLYLVLSLTASAVQEWIAAVVGLRASNLRAGLRSLLGDDYARRLYEHPLVRNLGKKNPFFRSLVSKSKEDCYKRPSYIAPDTLSSVLLAVLAEDTGGKSLVAYGAGEVRAAVEKIRPDHPLKPVLEVLADDCEGAATQLRVRLAGWFDEGMTRISGWYKRKATLIIFAIAALVTLAINASSIHIAEELWRNAALRETVAAEAMAAASEDPREMQAAASRGLETLPLGWDGTPDDFVGWFKTVLGWLITIAAVSLGAPFWFDLLGKVANLRGAGASVRRSEPDPPAAAADR